MTLAILTEARDQWYDKPEEGDWTWRGSVDPAAAREFLHTVLTDGPDPRVRVAAATMLRDIGQPIAVEHLVALAQESAMVAEKQEESGSSGRGGGAPPGPPPGVPAGVAGPPGGGSGGGGGGAADVPPKNFEEPEGRPLEPGDFAFPAPVPLYALKLLEETPGETVPQQLRALGEGYRNGALKAAAFKALTAAGGDAEREYLRGKAAEKPEKFDDLADWVNGLEMRLAAMAALGEAEDADFLPGLLDVLHESPPDEQAVGQAVQNYGAMSDWWQLKLTDWASRCLADVCRRQSPAALTGNSDLEEQLVRSMEELITDPGSARAALGDLAKTVRADAIRAFGRIASPSVYSHQLVVNRLVQSLGGLQEPQQGRGPRGRRGRGGRGQSQQQDELKIALLDAVTHMTTRAGGTQMEATLTRLVAEPELQQAWNGLMVQMAGYPTSGYFRLVDSMLGLLSQETIARIVREAGDAEGAGDPAFARAVAVALQGPLPEVEGPVVAEAPGRGQRRPGGRRTPSAPPGGPAGVEQDGPPEWMTWQMMAGQAAPPPEVTGGRQVSSRGPGRRRGSRGGRGSQRAEPGQGQYARHGARRRVIWSYSLDGLLDRLSELRAKERLVGLLLQSSGKALGDTLRLAGWLKGSVFGPEAAWRYLEREPGARDEVITELGNMLLVGLMGGSAGAPGPGFSAEQQTSINAETRRAAVLVLRRIGGAEAVEALYTGLVGPQHGDGARGVAGGGRSSPVAVPIARALGSMGQTARLRMALNAPGHLFFRSNATGVQKAALSGMAYLPPEQDPLQLLGGLLRQATVEELRAAVANALSTLVRRTEESGGETA